MAPMENLCTLDLVGGAPHQIVNPVIPLKVVD